MSIHNAPELETMRYEKQDFFCDVEGSILLSRGWVIFGRFHTAQDCSRLRLIHDGNQHRDIFDFFTGFDIEVRDGDYRTTWSVT